jgi:hypothetical protein
MKIVVGVARLARFRADGLEAFAPTTQALLNSLAPLVAFPLVGGLLEVGQGQFLAAITDLLATIVALLTPIVVTEALARRWGVGAKWPRFAVASNWCQWVLPMLLMAMLVALWLLAHLGMPITTSVVGACVIGVLVYGFMLHWFLARAALGLSRGRAALMVLVADLLTCALVLGPRLLAGGLAG